MLKDVEEVFIMLVTKCEKQRKELQICMQIQRRVNLF